MSNRCNFRLTTLIGLLATQAVMGQGFGQPTPQPYSAQSSLQQRPNTIANRVEGDQNSTNLTRFDLDFPGGKPIDLVQAIEKASGKPLNLVITPNSANASLPSLKMRGVNVPELFSALATASQQTVNTQSRMYGKQGFTVISNIFYNFQTRANPPQDQSVWYFSSQATMEPIGCRFWQLAPYLETYTIDDITTAVQTGYKMMGDVAPIINFHKDTKLLIAVGETSKLALIDALLEQLQSGVRTRSKSTTNEAKNP